MSNSDFSGWDFADIAKKTLINGLGFVPGPGPLLSAIAAIFWPIAKPDIWAEFAEKIAELIDVKIAESLNGILSGDITHAQARIKTVAELLSANPGSLEAHSAYNNLAEDLDGLDVKFMAFSDEINHQVLPLLSITLLMQISYWTMGLERSGEIGLSATDQSKLRGIIDRTQERAGRHITTLYKKVLNKALQDSQVENVANNVMAAHGYYRLHGIEYIELWEQIIAKKSLAGKVLINTISYSTFFGRQTARARMQALKSEAQLLPPLKPTRTENNTTNKIALIEGLEVRIGTALRVGGLSITFEDGNAYTLGAGSKAGSITVGNSELTSLEAWGNGAIDKLVFTLSDGRTLSVGARSSDNYMKFSAGELHAISGIYLSNDAPALAGQAANIAVSYRVIN